jgi:ubiquinol-cytochrome c reductase subunit 7
MTIFGPLGLSFAPQIRKSKTLYRWFKPVSDWYANIAGYRQIGLKYDDLREQSILLELVLGHG